MGQITRDSNLISREKHRYEIQCIFDDHQPNKDLSVRIRPPIDGHRRRRDHGQAGPRRRRRRQQVPVQAPARRRPVRPADRGPDQVRLPPQPGARGHRRRVRRRGQVRPHRRGRVEPQPRRRRQVGRGRGGGGGQAEGGGNSQDGIAISTYGLLGKFG